PLVRVAQHEIDVWTRRAEALTIVDLGSADYNGSYRAIFAQPAWRYLGVDLAPGPNVDLVLRDAYQWSELRSGSVDALVSGQTFEHTEYFWVTMLEIARVLKPGGYTCIIAPAAGPEHRYPVDCWRFFADGLRAVARYAGLKVVHARTQWEDLPSYDAESNKWHESVLIVRKPLGWEQRREGQALPSMIDAWVQVFYSTDGTHREEASVYAGVERGDWDEVTVLLPEQAGAAPLRIDFAGNVSGVNIERIAIRTATVEYFSAQTPADFDVIIVSGDARRLPDEKLFRLEISGADPQLILPPLAVARDTLERLQVHLRVRVHP
ncbi:MAG TPA: methyltransferase domain-containing protein, partial [Chthoniobacterales bacterium]|nr:methyltransferase domain-containing protein [Chthoniobacterales bacterium]